MYEIKSSLGVTFIIRSDTVDQINLEWMSESIFIHELFKANLTDQDFIIDMGSHIGTFSLPAVFHKRCRAICFEPDKESLIIAKASATLNELDHLIDFHQAAVGGSDGTIILYEADQNWSHTIISHGGPSNKLTGVEHEVPLVSLDTALRYVPETARLFVKFNTEGAEFEMFRRASKSVLERVDSFVGEVHHDLGLGDFEPCVSRLQEAGFLVDLIPQGECRDILVARKKADGRSSRGE